MKIIVSIKQVPVRDSQLRIDAGGRWIQENDLSFEINEPDAYALEEALQLKEKHGGEVVALCVGPGRASQTIREALAKGADRAIHIEEENLTSFDTLGIAKLLAKAAEAEKPDLVLTGLQSDDLGYGQTGVVLAEIMGLPHDTIIMAVVETDRGVREQRGHGGGVWTRMSWETLAAGQQLAAQTGASISAAVVGQGIDALAGELAQKKLDKVYAVTHDLLAAYTADGYTAALEQLIKKASPSIVLFPHTYQVRDFAPKLAVRFAQVLISDAVGFRVESGSAIFVRQLFQGKLNSDVRPGGPEPHFASMQAGSFRAEQLEQGSAQVENFTPQLSADAIRQKPMDPFREATRAVDLTAADIIVSVGRGIKEKENIPIVE